MILRGTNNSNEYFMMNLSNNDSVLRRIQFWIYVVLFLCMVMMMSGVDATFIDPDTPKTVYKTKALTVGDDREYQLVFSDEFEEEGRTFVDGNDPRWCAANKNDYTNAALHFYSQDNVKTSKGVLNITVEQKVNDYKAYDEVKKFFYADKKYIQTGLVQSWNKFCFIGGVVEFSAKLPGDPKKGGLWPALWMLGNLARATYVGSSDYVWPYSYNKCDIKNQRSQFISACDRVNHYGMAAYTGRGSPEIDILETMQGEYGPLPSTHIQKPYQSTSLQVAPGIEMDRPVLGLRPHPEHWYHYLEYSPSNNSDLNPFFYGVTLVHWPKIRTYQSDAISANRQLNKSHYETQHKYRVEWEPPNWEGEGGYVRWYTDDEFVFGMRGDSLDIMQTEIPSEPMYLIMNVAVSHTWGFPSCPEGCGCKCYECGNPDCQCALPMGYCENFPANFEIDYVRVWQAKNETKHVLGCSPEHRPTKQFIEGHAKNYMTEGQKRPLEDVRHGGGLCSVDADCGSKPMMGICSSAGVCICSDKYTGPHCKAPNGYFDVDTSKKQPVFNLSHIRLPASLQIILVTLITGFIIIVICTKRAKVRQKRYEKIRDVHGAVNGSSALPRNVDTTIMTSYQDSAAVYTLPSDNKKDVTYCVIDGRLVDNS